MTEVSLLNSLSSQVKSHPAFRHSKLVHPWTNHCVASFEHPYEFFVRWPKLTRRAHPWMDVFGLSKKLDAFLLSIKRKAPKVVILQTMSIKLHQELTILREFNDRPSGTVKRSQYKEWLIG